MKKWECTVCGYIHTGAEPPDECPVCKASKDKFVEIPAENEKSDVKKEENTVPEKASQGFLSQLVMKNHLHPISVHSPNGIVPMAVVFLLLAIGFDSQTLASAAYFSLIFVLLAMPPVLISGYITWVNKYSGAKTALFKTKIAASRVAITILLILVVWKTMQPDVLSSASLGRWLFMFLALVLLAAVGLAGHLGGKLVFGVKE